jgi:hypothetical protein
MTDPFRSDPVWSERTPDDQDEDRVEQLDGLPEDGEEKGHPTTASDVGALIAKEIA